MLALLSTLLLIVGGQAGAQPYVADGGFARPRIGFDVTRAHLAAAIDGGHARLLVADVRGVRLVDLEPGAPLAAPAARALADVTSVRGVAAASGWGPEGHALYAWFVRDPRSGRYVYTWQWGDDQRELLDATQILDLALFLGPEGPEAWVALPDVAGARLERYRWDAAEPDVMLRSDRSLAAPTLARGPAGERHLAYLEGATVASPIGVSAEWSVVYRAPDGTVRRLEGALPPPATLRIDPGEATLVLWQRDDWTVMVSDVTSDEAGRALGPGRPLGIVADRAFRVSGATIVADALVERAGAHGEANVAWSPDTIDHATLVRAGDVTHLVWTGSLAGGGARVLASDDATAFAPAWHDHVAAWFGWNPWALAEEAIGQATGALLVGVLGTMVLLPLLWLASLALARRTAEHRMRTAGALTAAGTLTLLAALAAGRAASLGNDATPLLGGVGGFLTSLLVGVTLAHVLLRGVDLEPQPAALIAASLTCFASLTLIAFLAFQPWLDLLGM